MSHKRSERPVSLMPVTRLISRPLLALINGQLAAVMVLETA